MGMQQMGSQGDGGSNGKQSQLQPLATQNSMYSLTLDEVQNQLGDLGKPLSSMNLDELLKTIWTAEANQGACLEVDGSQLANQTALPRQSSLSLTGALSKKTVDVWRDIQLGKNNREKKSRDWQSTLGEMTLEDFLAKAGVVAEASMENRDDSPVVGVDANAVPLAAQLQQPGHWMQYPLTQYQRPQENMIGVYMPGQTMQQPLHMGAGPFMDVPFTESQVALSSPLMGTLSDSQAARKRGNPEDIIGKSVERRQKRMIKNRESAARSRARKQKRYFWIMVGEVAEGEIPQGFSGLAEKEEDGVAEGFGSLLPEEEHKRRIYPTVSLLPKEEHIKRIYQTISFGNT